MNNLVKYRTVIADLKREYAELADTFTRLSTLMQNLVDGTEFSSPLKGDAAAGVDHIARFVQYGPSSQL